MDVLSAWTLDHANGWLEKIKAATGVLNLKRYDAQEWCRTFSPNDPACDYSCFVSAAESHYKHVAEFAHFG